MNSVTHIPIACLQAVEGCWRKILQSGWYYYKSVFTRLNWDLVYHPGCLNMQLLPTFSKPLRFLPLFFRGTIAFYFTGKTEVFKYLCYSRRCMIRTNTWLINIIEKAGWGRENKHTHILHVLFFLWWFF